MIEQQKEWLAIFRVSGPESAAFTQQDAEILWNTVIRWAEQQRLGIGGSYKLGLRGIVFRFGVCVTRAEQVIERSRMDELLQLVAARLPTGATLEGGFRRFTDDETDAEALNRIVTKLERSIN